MKQTILDNNKLYDAVAEIYSKSSYMDEEHRYADCIKEYAEECVIMFCESTMRDMNKYIHMKDHSIYGNFNNIEWDYEREYDGKSFLNLVVRLDAGEVQEDELKDVQEWAQGWFFETFGTYNIRYNFETNLGEYIYELEKEDEDL